MGRRGEHSKDQLAAMALDAAVELLETEGADKLTTRAVAARIGYTVGSLYFLFRNRDDLVLQVNERTLEELEADLHAALGCCADPEEALLAMGRGYIAYARAHPARWRLVFEFQPGDEDAVPTSLLARIDALFALVAARLVELVGDEGDAGLLRRTAQTLWSGVHGIAVLSVSGKVNAGGEVAPEALMEDLVRCYLRGLRKG